MQDTEILERVETAGANVAAYDRPAEAVLVEDGEDEEEHLGWSGDYDISVIPNDFNVSTLCNFLDKGVIVVPDFQRDYVWDKGKASRFIESVAVGLPVPEFFFYAANRNEWWVVDGQQRMMSIYYFRKGRFPRAGGAVEVSRLMRKGGLPREMWDDNQKFSRFALALKSRGGRASELHGQTFENLEERLALRPLRAIVIRQHSPNGDNAAFEIFDRLNTGGVKLSAQQIRTCVFYSPFLRMADKVNRESEGWRRIYGKNPERDQRDVQVIVRALALLMDGENYAPLMLRFLNNFCREMSAAPEPEVARLRGLFEGFVRACANAEKSFRIKGFRAPLFEAVFVAALRECHREGRMPEGAVNPDAIRQLSENKDFEGTTLRNSTATDNVRKRMKIARDLIAPL